MAPKHLISVLLLMELTLSAQTILTADVGLGVIEHSSVGLTVQLGDKNRVSTLFGSNLFIKTKSFSNLFLQYEYSFTKLNVSKAVPHLGIKGGDSYFSDSYYRWHVVNVIPFAGVRYHLKNRSSVFADAGVSKSFIQSAERIKLGEIGHYKDYLFELKVGLNFTLYEKKK